MLLCSKRRANPPAVKHVREQIQAAAHVALDHRGSQHRASLVDTGASYHIIDPVELTKSEIKRATDLIELGNIACAGEPFGRDNR